MSGVVLILGSGKMARDIGAFLLGRGCDISWMAGNRGRLDGLEKFGAKTLRRLARIDPRNAPPPSPACYFRGERVARVPDVIIETTVESVDEKRKAFDAVEHARGVRTLLASNSSSIPPERIHRECVGMHFFYPAQLCPVVEIIVPPALEPRRGKQAVDIAARWGFHCIVESPRNAFAVNRLMLPVQAECMRALAGGFPPADVDECSRSDCLPAGQLSIIDSVGIDVVCAGVGNYLDMTDPAESGDYIALRDSLRLLLDCGKLGNKNGNGLLCGDELPWPRHAVDRETRDRFRRTIRALFLKTCRRFIKNKMLDVEDMRRVFTSVLQSDISFRDACATEPDGA